MLACLIGTFLLCHNLLDSVNFIKIITKIFEEATKGKGSGLYCFGSLLDSSDQSLKEGFSMSGTEVFV